MGRERKEVEDGRKNVNMMSLMSVRVKDNLIFLKKSVCAQLFFFLKYNTGCTLPPSEALQSVVDVESTIELENRHVRRARHESARFGHSDSRQRFPALLWVDIFLLLTMPCVFFITINQFNYMHTWCKKASQSNAATVAQARTRQ